jgi:hypothetical protein
MVKNGQFIWRKTMSETYIKMDVPFGEVMNFWGENWFKQELGGWDLDNGNIVYRKNP